MSKIGMPAFTLKKQHNFDHFEVHIFAQIHIIFILKNGEGTFLHGLPVFGALSDSGFLRCTARPIPAVYGEVRLSVVRRGR